jgi:crossover junction endodeoxyribonuclease RusA
VIKFTVYGKPIAQGSKKHVGRGILVESAKGLPAWRKAIHAAAFVANNGRLLCAREIPVEVTMNFFFERPKSVKRSEMTVKPDCDKLVRAIFDGITGALIHDDSQIVSHYARKYYGTPERAEIVIAEVE